MSISKFLMALGLSLVGLAHFQNVSAAEPYPTKPIKIIVGYPAGGANDLVARSVAVKLTESLGQSVIVENVSGAAGTIGAATGAKAAPDGYTLFMAAGAHTLAPSVRKSLPYDIVKDFAPISIAAIGAYVLVVNPSVKARTVSELIELAKASPGKLTFASSGVGAPPHLAGVLYQEMTGSKLHHVPFRGDADANTALLAGHVDLYFASIGPTMPLIESGKVKALAVTTKQRSSALPDVPTLSESGVQGYSVGTWWGLLAPAGTPPAVVDKLAIAVKNATSDPAIREKFKSMGVEASYNMPGEFAKFIESEVATYKNIAKTAGIEPQ